MLGLLGIWQTTLQQGIWHLMWDERSDTKNEDETKPAMKSQLVRPCGLDSIYVCVCVCVYVCVCKTDRERERQTDRQTDRQTETERDRERQRDRHRHRETETKRQRQKDRQTERQRQRDRGHHVLYSCCHNPWCTRWPIVLLTCLFLATDWGVKNGFTQLAFGNHIWHPATSCCHLWCWCARQCSLSLPLPKKCWITNISSFYKRDYVNFKDFSLDPGKKNHKQEGD
jgi:Ni/Co efflux regulator RcnB